MIQHLIVSSTCRHAPTLCELCTVTRPCSSSLGPFFSTPNECDTCSMPCEQAKTASDGENEVRVKRAEQD